MRFEIHGSKLSDAAEPSRLVTAALTCALLPWAARIGRVRVLLDEPGLEGVIRCHLLVELPPGGGVGVGEVGLDLEDAVERCGRRAREAIAHELARRRAENGQGPRPLAYSLHGPRPGRRPSRGEAARRFSPDTLAHGVRDEGQLPKDAG